MLSRRGKIRRKERVRVYTRRIGDWNKPSLNFAGVMCCSPLQTISAAQQARARVDIYMGMRIGIGTSYHQVLRAQCSAPRCRRPQLLNTIDKGRLCQIRASPDAKQVERHHFFLACRSLRDNHILFRIFDFSILGSPDRPSINIDIIL